MLTEEQLLMLNNLMYIHKIQDKVGDGNQVSDSYKTVNDLFNYPEYDEEKNK